MNNYKVWNRTAEDEYNLQVEKYVQLLRMINNCKSQIEKRKKNEQDYSSFQFQLEVLNKKLSKMKPSLFNY